MSDQADLIKDYILSTVTSHPEDIVSCAMETFSVTRTTVRRHLNKLIAGGLIIKTGETRDAKYFLTSSIDKSISYSLKSTLSEYTIFNENFDSALSTLPENIYSICYYGLTEIINNAIDHSEGNKLTVSSSLKKKNLTLTIEDDGIGIFKKLYDYFKLDDLRESVLQLSKGKMSTDPTNHTGEGIFFTSRAFDTFQIYANGLHYLRDNDANDWALEIVESKKPGSLVKMSISIDAQTKLNGVFLRYEDPESLHFNRTEITVALSKFNEEILMSRSQAKRILRDLEKFQYVTLDFSKIKLVGQGFVDEIFRVFQNQHPEINISYTHATEDVAYMIKRGIANAKS